MKNELLTLRKLKNDIRAAKMFFCFFPKQERTKILEMEKQLGELERIISKYQDYYSDLGWCAYDSMDADIMKEAVEKYEIEGPDAGEDTLLNYYQEGVKNKVHLITNERLFSVRRKLLDSAFEDHFNSRFYASVPLFLIVIDGTVNDYTKEKGFFSEGTDVSAWDCLVGCNDGLAKMKEIFNTSRKKTNRDEICMPFRNGIIHGRDVEYGNAYVSCKCVALLFAIKDWMRMRDSAEERKEKYKNEINPPSIIDTLHRMRDLNIQNNEISKWKPRTIKVGVDIPKIPEMDDCEEYQYILPVIQVFDAWKKKNWGDLSRLLSKLFAYEQSERKRAGECREMFSSKELCSFELVEIEERACSMTRILVRARWNIEGKKFSELLEFGSAYQDENGEIRLPWQENGKWILIPWDINGLYKN